MKPENMLKFGMVGGSLGSFMGNVHRTAVKFDEKAKLVAGCFSRDYEKTLETGKELGLEQEKLYENIEEMTVKEAGKLDFVSIVVPNYAHYEAAKAFLENGINVYCEKPLTFTVEEAEELKAKYEQKLKDARSDAQEIVDNAESRANKKAKDIINQAEARAEKLKAKKLEEIEQAKKEAAAVLRDEIADYTILAANKLIQEQLDQEKHQQMIMDFIDDLDAEKLGEVQ
jgi:ATP synthase F0 subunit b